MQLLRTAKLTLLPCKKIKYSTSFQSSRSTFESYVIETL